MFKIVTIVFQLICLVVVISWGIRIFDSYYQTYNSYGKYKQVYENKVDELNKLKAEMVKKTDPYEIEKNIRNNLNLSKENEQVVVINTAKKVLGVSTNEATASSEASRSSQLTTQNISDLFSTIKNSLSTLPIIGKYIH